MNDPTKLDFFASTPEPCSYLQDQSSVSAFANPHINMTMSIYNNLIQHGFRRSGGYVYRPHCPTCQQCISVRVPVREHKLSRNEQRAIRRNSDIVVTRAQMAWHDEHFELYRRYINSRHGDGSMANPNKDDYYRFLICDWAETICLEFRLDGELIGVAVCDHMSSGLSAVYTFFDPELASRSLGHFAILKQIEQAKTLDLDYLYLGYWINDCDKMSYKSRYRPLEAYINDRWSPLVSTNPESLANLSVHAGVISR